MIPLAGDVAFLLAGGVGGWAAARAWRGRNGHTAPLPAPTAPQPRDVEVFERLIEALPMAAVAVDERGLLRFVNAPAAALFRIDTARAHGRALIEVVPSVELERLMRRALAGEKVSGTVVLHRSTDDTTVQVAALPAEGSGGGALVVAEDRTRHVQIERVRRDFISDVSHELRTPLSSIKLMVETIELSSRDPEAVKMFMPKIATELTRIANLVEDLLALARNESGQARLRRRTVELRALIDDALETFRPRAEALEIELTFDRGQKMKADVDPERMIQVLVNLIDNALRHTPPKGHVRVRLDAVDDAALVSVEDDGVGIPFKDLPHVFERFYVVERSRARESSGTGLGLAIVRQIVEAHGGTIRVESELGSGARFVCRVPRSA